jgi:hypothetical protein
MTVEITTLAEVGTYVSAAPNQATREMIAEAILADGHPAIRLAYDRYRPSRYHTTILFSRKHHPEIEALRYGLIEGVIRGVEKFDIRPEGDVSVCALVLTINSPLLTMRHDWLRQKYGATHDFDEYTPHITIGYSVPTSVNLEWECPHLLSLIGQKVGFTHEKVEPLNLNWK